MPNGLQVWELGATPSAVAWCDSKCWLLGVTPSVVLLGATPSVVTLLQSLSIT